ncbi:hypothetical protein HHK36_003691 [Tetracentron sinense]|uniref:Large ribosomal subunit protein bL21m n=1 Tax=Tetracentron sinense TaxID=13715 RepID=A0A835DNU4_TETSI|nr:hypothetical protein HHK36_003691 [Tetracentron sinense]
MMWKRRGLNVLIRHGQSILHSSASVQCPRTLPRIHTISAYDPLPMENFDLNIYRSRRNLESLSCIQSKSIRHFSYRRRNSSEHDDEDEADEVESGEEDEGEMEESSDEEGECNDVLVSNCSVKRVYSVEEKEKESAAIGYKVIGPLDSSERPFKAWEPVFAVVQIGSHQFKVSNGDCIYTERLKFCEVNDKV